MDMIFDGEEDDGAAAGVTDFPFDASMDMAFLSSGSSDNNSNRPAQAMPPAPTVGGPVLSSGRNGAAGSSSSSGIQQGSLTDLLTQHTAVLRQNGAGTTGTPGMVPSLTASNNNINTNNVSANSAASRQTWHNDAVDRPARKAMIVEM